MIDTLRGVNLKWMTSADFSFRVVVLKNGPEYFVLKNRYDGKHGRVKKEELLELLNTAIDNGGCIYAPRQLEIMKK